MRPEKISIVKEYGEKFKESEFVFLADYRGLTVEQVTQLREQLRKHETQINVISNGLFRIVLKEMGRENMLGCLKGPTAMISGKGDASAVAKMLRDFCSENNLPLMKGGEMEGGFLSPDDIAVIADLPSRHVMLSMLVGTIAAPLQQLVGVLNQKISSIVYVLKAVEEKKGK